MKAAVAAAVLAALALLLAGRPPEIASVLLVGDVMLSRNVAARLREKGDPLLPFRGASALLSSADFNFGNLEAPFWTEPAIGGSSLIFAAPAEAVEGLRHYHFRVVSLANNHALDQDEEGLDYTLALLADNGIQAAGAGRNLDEAWQARTVTVRGMRIAFLAVSYASVNDGGKKRNALVARMEDLGRLRSRLRALKREGAFVVVSMHAGVEYTAAPDPAQVAFARAAIDAGADVVAGSHPHWVQPVERYHGGLIFYSLGNFIFDLDSSPETQRGLAARLVFVGERLAGARLYPVRIENRCCPTVPFGPGPYVRP